MLVKKEAVSILNLRRFLFGFDVFSNLVHYPSGIFEYSRKMHKVKVYYYVEYEVLNSYIAICKSGVSTLSRCVFI